MALSHGDYSASRIREITACNIRLIGISSPAGGSALGSPVDISYILESDSLVSATNLEAEYSTDGGSNYSTCTADATDPDHEGTSGLSADADGNTHTFVWDAATDLTTAFQNPTMKVRVRAYDGSVWSNHYESATFEIDMLPGVPTLYSPANLYFDADTTPDLQWLIPADPGSDRIHFAIEIDDGSDFASLQIDHNSQDDLDRFMHLIETSPGLKEACNRQAFYVRDLDVTAFTATTVSYADLTSYYTATAVTTTLTNPQILLVNKNDRRCFIDPATITATGFDIAKSSVGIDTDGKVDLIIWSDAALDYDSYWVDLTGVTDNTAYTYGAGSFATDILGNAIPGTIAHCRPLILEGNDCPVFAEGITDTGFTIRLSAGRAATTGTVRVCLRATPADAYVSSAEDVTSVTQTLLDYSDALDDITNGGAAWPNDIPGPVMCLQGLTDRQVIMTRPASDHIDVYKSSAGIATDGQIDVQGGAEPDANLPYWTDVSTYGVPDSYEGKRCRYIPLAADALTAGYWHWRVRGANS